MNGMTPLLPVAAKSSAILPRDFDSGAGRGARNLEEQGQANRSGPMRSVRRWIEVQEDSLVLSMSSDVASRPTSGPILTLLRALKKWLFML